MCGHPRAGAKRPPRRVPGMTIDLEVEVFPEPDRRDRRETQGRACEGRSEGSVKRICEPTNRNRIRGRSVQGEPATNGEALAVKGRTGISGGCAETADGLTQGDLALRLKGRRHRRRSEESADAVVASPQDP
jgi:hypothetical protein